MCSHCFCHDLFISTPTSIKRNNKFQYNERNVIVFKLYNYVVCKLKYTLDKLLAFVMRFMWKTAPSSRTLWTSPLHGHEFLPLPKNAIFFPPTTERILTIEVRAWRLWTELIQSINNHMSKFQEWILWHLFLKFFLKLMQTLGVQSKTDN